MFIKTTEKAYKLDIIKNEIIKKIVKEQRTVIPNEIDLLVNKLTCWYIERMNLASAELYDSRVEIVELANEDKKVLLDIFDQNSLFQHLVEERTYETKVFMCDDDFRRKVLSATLYNIIDKAGQKFGAEYGLVFAKTYNFKLSIPLHYVSYEHGITDPALMNYINTYLEIGGPLDTYVLPKYYEEKNKYDLEDLKNIIAYFNNYYNMKPYDVAGYAKNLKKEKEL